VAHVERGLGQGCVKMLEGWRGTRHQTRRNGHATSEAFVLGTITGAVITWLWGREIAGSPILGFQRLRAGFTDLPRPGNYLAFISPQHPDKGNSFEGWTQVPI
jgi:hypothetical protein